MMRYIDIKTNKLKRQNAIGKNEYVRQMLKKEFVMLIKPDRNISLSEIDQKNKVWTKVELLVFRDNTSQQVWIEDVLFPLLLIKQVFINEDKSPRILYLITSDLTLSYTDITDLHQKRWEIKRHHQSIK